MLAKRIIPCLDVKENQVVKGVAFTNHQVMGGVVELAQAYQDQDADELVFYDITASPEGRSVSKDWVEAVGKILSIPFCVAGGIRSVEQARVVLNAGADKISVNSPALARPSLIDELVQAFGSQCVVVGVDSLMEDGQYYVYEMTGSDVTRKKSKRDTMTWLAEIQNRGAGEVVLNCMAQDGQKNGYDVDQLLQARNVLSIPLVASGGAGTIDHFFDVFDQANVDGALAASVFHKKLFSVGEVKNNLSARHIEMRV